MKETDVKKHVRKGRNKASVVRKHKRRSLTHRVRNGRKEVFVDGFWKHDDYPNAPKPGWSYERLVKERASLMKDLDDGLRGVDVLPARKYGLLTRRIKKIDRILKHKRNEQN